MPDYVFEALTPQGVLEKGRLSARDEEELAEYLRDRGQFLVRSEPRAAQEPKPAPRVDRKLHKDELLAFTEYIAGSLQVGIPLMTALEDSRGRIESKRLRVIVAALAHSMAEHGMSLSDAMAQHPKAFSKVYVGTVAAGEASGHLDYALRQLADYLDWQQEISVQVRQALLYPTIVVFIVLGLMTLLLAFVYPRILPVLAGYNVELPWITQLFTNVADFLRNHWYVPIGVLAGTAGAIWGIRQTDRGRYAMDVFLLRAPVFGPLVQRINMARLVTYFALFYRTGVELILSLTLVEDMMQNRRVAEGVARVRAAVVEGSTITAAFAADPIFPPEIVRGVSLGEATGSMDEALGRVRSYYAREVPASVKRMLTALQPVLIISLGGMILLVALSIMLPVVSIYENLGRMR